MFKIQQQFLEFSSEGSCPEDFYLAEEDGDICYFVSATSETYNWHDAKSTCENKGASLAELKTDDEFYAVEIVLLTYGMRATFKFPLWKLI